MKRKWMILLLVTALLLTALGGCGKESAPESVRVGSLKGATSLGLLHMMDQASAGNYPESYDFTMATAADEILPLLMKGEMDIALIPANAAANLYQKSEGGIEVIDINTLGVLHFVTGNPEITSIESLRGKTIYTTGKGTMPEASLRYVLSKNNMTEEDYTVEFKSEPTEVAAVLAEDPNAVGLLPQPFVTVACMQNEALSAVIDLNEEWDKVADGSRMVTGVTVVRKAFLEEYPQAVESFLNEHGESVAMTFSDVDKAAALAVEQGIVPKEPIAKKAIPQCSIVCISGADMKSALEGNLQVLYDFNAELVGGALPGDDFYYVK